jgi:hypothetical protein
MMAQVRKNFGVICGEILEEFILYGRLKLSDCIALLKESRKDWPELGEISEQEIIEAVGALVKGLYLVSVDDLKGAGELVKSMNGDKNGMNGKDFLGFG